MVDTIGQSQMELLRKIVSREYMRVWSTNMQNEGKEG